MKKVFLIIACMFLFTGCSEDRSSNSELINLINKGNAEKIEVSFYPYTQVDDVDSSEIYEYIELFRSVSIKEIQTPEQFYFFLDSQ